MTALVLSLFPGIGLFDLAFEGLGFAVVRGPDTLWGGDIKRFSVPAGRFDGIIGGPPCQAFSRLRHIVEANGYQTAEDLIPEFERVVSEAHPVWFVMENVPAAPEPVVAGYAVASVLLNNRWFGGVQNRERRFSFGARGSVALEPWRYLETVALEAIDWAAAVTGGARAVPVKLAPSGRVKRTHTAEARSLAEACRLQGVPEDFLDHAPFTAAGKQRVIGNGVPRALGDAVAGVVLGAVYGRTREERTA